MGGPPLEVRFPRCFFSFLTIGVAQGFLPSPLTVGLFFFVSPHALSCLVGVSAVLFSWLTGFGFAKNPPTPYIVLFT